MQSLTEFQVRCVAALEDLLGFRGFGFSREVSGNDETYIHIKSDEADLEMWIYDDEAEVRSRRTRCNFEASVFRDEGERIAGFICEVAASIDP